MRSKSEAANELIALFSQYGLEPFLESTRTLVVLLDSKGGIVFSNPAFAALRQTRSNAADFKEFLSQSAQAEFDQFFRSVLRDQKAARIEFGFDLNGRCGLYDCFLIPLGDDRVLFFGEPASTEDDLSAHERLQGQIQQLQIELQETKRALEVKQKELQAVLAQADEVAHTDALTFLPNHRLIISDLQRQVMYSERYGVPLTISMLDLDHFKLVNDVYGHQTGDQVLRFIASELRDNIRQPDEIGRYGGEEFLVLLPNSTVTAAGEQATRLCRQVRSTPIISGHNIIHMTVSIGIAQYKIHEEDWKTLLDRADQALYQAKHNGRDQWVILES